MRPVLALSAVALVTLAAGCGDSGPTPEEQVRDVLTRFATAAEKRDYGTLCSKVFAPKLLAGLEAIGLPCEVAMRNSLGQVKDPKLTVGQVDVQGAQATAEVRTSAEGQQPSSDTVRLDRIDGDWKISALGGGSATPTATPTGEAG